jgi:hypothetical protein
MSLPENFKNELATIYADNKPGRREHILGAVARLRSKYSAKLMNARRDDPNGADEAERAIVKIENEYAARLAA